MRKKRRYQGRNKIKLSNTVRRVSILIAICMIALGSGYILKSLEQKTETISDSKEIYKYSNKYEADPKINLKENKYIQSNEIIEGQAYLSDLISDIDINMNYEYKASKQSKIIYNYKIEAIVNASYGNTKSTYDVLNKMELLKEETNLEKDAQDFKINENINVNYDKYHQMIKEFKQTLGINADSYLCIKLTVNTKTDIDSKEVENHYESKYKITLGDKVAVVDAENKDETTKKVQGEVYRKEKGETDYRGAIIGSIIMIIGILVLKIILTNTEELRCIKNEFRLELNRILKAYEDKIVEIQNIDNIDIETATKVKDIMQLRKLAEEALVPIYCYVNEDINNEEAYFITINYGKSYIYILK